MAPFAGDGRGVGSGDGGVFGAEGFGLFTVRDWLLSGGKASDTDGAGGSGRVGGSGRGGARESRFLAM